MAITTSPMKSNNDEKLHSPGQPGMGKAEGAKDLVSSLGEKAKDAAAAVAHTAEDAASYVGRNAEDATAAVGSRLKSLGSSLRANAPHNGMVGEASAAVANTLENAGRHLQEEGLKGIADDVTNLIRRNPIPALLAGIGIGFLIGRATTRGS